MHNPFAGMKKREWALWMISLAVVIATNLLSGDVHPATVAGTLVGVTALIFLARGDVWGQILTVAFSLLYAVTSWQFRYWGELITYLGMTLPMAVMSIVSWLRHPFEDSQEVAIQRLSRKQKVWCGLWTLAATGFFGWILWLLDTPNLLMSILSITTSFLAAYLTFQRSSFYALAYAGNDVVLIVLWVLAAMEHIAYAPMIACFAMFLVNDLYGFVSWRKREKKQGVA